VQEHGPATAGRRREEDAAAGQALGRRPLRRDRDHRFVEQGDALSHLSPRHQRLALAGLAGSRQVPLAQAADATSLPVPDASFERAICVQVLEYVRDVPAALKEMYRALRPGGRVLVWDVDWATVSWQAIDRQLARRVLAVWDKHLTHPSLPRTLAAQLRNAGFEDVRMDAHAFATTELIPDAYGGSLVPLHEQYVADQGGMSQKAKAWADEQRELGDRGEFFFTVTQFCYTATRRS